MPKTSAKSPPSHWRPSPYGNHFPRSRWQSSSSLPTTLSGSTPGNEENRSLQTAQESPARPRPKAFQLPTFVTTPSFEAPAGCTEFPTTGGNAIPPPANGHQAAKIPQVQAPNGLPGRPSFTRYFVPYTPKPNPTDIPKPEIKPDIKPRIDLTMVDSMALKAVSRPGNGTQQPPGLTIHSNSSGGGVQFNVFTKVPTVSKTIAFNVKNEEALVQAYRHVKAMNPSADVGGIMFCVAPKGGSFTTTQNIDWSSLAGRLDHSGHNHNFPRPHSQYYRPSKCESPALFFSNWLYVLTFRR
ncbi:uncharacterized protein FTOL_08340 [Fusarium torulosum]|uniref:Uncharacterized protein n=1 Tax=Fusarium torulosum TaxID=33205 RepID=A0AAE8MCG3_9HYPO|nr:uncharacterized protein FTOL_08340 [Fusarium torulosum]